MSFSQELYNINKELLSLGEVEMSDHLLCALAAIGETRLTFSGAMREVRKKYDNEKVKEFQKAFKNAFEEAIDADVDDPEGVALTKTLKEMQLEVGDA